MDQANHEYGVEIDVGVRQPGWHSNLSDVNRITGFLMSIRKITMPTSELPEQFLYNRKGPWPQPSPSHPMICADEVLHIPPKEEDAFNSKIQDRLNKDVFEYLPEAAWYVWENEDWAGPTDARFDEIMFDTLCTKFLKPLDERAKRYCKQFSIPFDENTRKYDFSAMNLVEPLAGTYCAGVILIIDEDEKKQRKSACIIFIETATSPAVCVKPTDSAWSLAKIYALQGASYHVLFVVHPALHFPMVSVNAITKTSLPMAHPIFQLLYPHCSYQLALDYRVLEGAYSVVNNDAQGTKYDPLTANGFNLKVLFGAGYTGLPANKYGNAYPVYDYMKPQMGFDSDYGRWLEAYMKPFLGFCTTVADFILRSPHLHDYVTRWARYNHTHVLGFPDEKEIFEAGVLAQVLAIFMWDVTVAHGADHASYAEKITAVEKCLRIRRAPPKSADEPPVKSGEIFDKYDLGRASLCQYVFFKTWAIEPNLNDTTYAFTDKELVGAAKKFRQELTELSQRRDIHQYMPLTPSESDNVPYGDTIPQSIQY